MIEQRIRKISEDLQTYEGGNGIENENGKSFVSRGPAYPSRSSHGIFNSDFQKLSKIPVTKKGCNEGHLLSHRLFSFSQFPGR